jgi:hypothetical protein
MKRDFPPPPPTPKDSLESNYPDVIDTTLDYGLSTVCAFNRRGSDTHTHTHAHTHTHTHTHMHIYTPHIHTNVILF